MTRLRYRWRRGLLLAAGLLGLGARPVSAVDSSSALESVTFRGQGFLVYTVDPKQEDLQLFWNGDDNKPLHDFTGLEKFVASKGEQLVFAANAGIFQVGSTPLGLLVLDGNETTPLNLKDGDGNFYMKPNGVFLINDKHEAHVIESSDYAAILSPTVWATQSGPLLVHGGDINPDFNADSKNVNVRSGVGVRKDGTIVFAISRGQVNFYNFASLFLARLKCSNALYLDGTISAFYVPGLKDEVPQSFGPMFGLVEKARNP